MFRHQWLAVARFCPVMLYGMSVILTGFFVTNRPCPTCVFWSVIRRNNGYRVSIHTILNFNPSFVTNGTPYTVCRMTPDRSNNATKCVRLLALDPMTAQRLESVLREARASIRFDYLHRPHLPVCFLLKIPAPSAQPSRFQRLPRQTNHVIERYLIRDE